MTFWKLDNREIERALAQTRRQYLAGDLALPQIVKNFKTSEIEIGISDYREAAMEDAHFHKVAHEFQYVIEGMTEYIDVSTEEVWRFRRGDFYAIAPGTTYVQRIKQGTRILFVKVPAGNDKVSADLSAKLAEWANTPLRVERQDFSGEDIPEPNSVVPATAAAIFDSEGRILLIKRRDSEKWAMPGGRLEMGEDLQGCVRREVLEETGLEIELLGIIGTYTDPKTIVAYSDGEVRREFSIVFHARPLSGTLALDEESTSWKWVSTNDALKLTMAASQRRRVEDVISFQKSGKISVR